MPPRASTVYEAVSPPHYHHRLVTRLSSMAPFPGRPSSSYPGHLHPHASLSPDRLHPPAAPSLTLTAFDSADAEMTINKTLSPAAFTTVVTGESSQPMLANFIFRLTNSKPKPRHYYHPLLQAVSRTFFTSVHASYFLRHSSVPLSSPINQSRHQSTRKQSDRQHSDVFTRQSVNRHQVHLLPAMSDRRYRSLRVCSGSIFQPTRHF